MLHGTTTIIADSHEIHIYLLPQSIAHDGLFDVSSFGFISLKQNKELIKNLFCNYYKIIKCLKLIANKLKKRYNKSNVNKINYNLANLLKGKDAKLEAC